jgi:hypothetical protein
MSAAGPQVMKLNRRRTAREKNEAYGPFFPRLPYVHRYDNLSLANVTDDANGLPRRQPRAKSVLKSYSPKRLAAELSGQKPGTAPHALVGLSERKLKRSSAGTSLVEHARQGDDNHSCRADACARAID